MHQELLWGLFWVLAAEESKFTSFLDLITSHSCSEGSARDRSRGDTLAVPLLSLDSSSKRELPVFLKLQPWFGYGMH